MACSIRSITLQPGESYVLPAGAQIIGATDVNSISSNGCANLDNAETAECYAVAFIETNTIGGQTPYYDDVEIYGIRINEADYPFASGPIQAFSTNTSAIIAAIESCGLGITNIQCANYTGVSANTDAWKITFKSYPSLVGSGKRMSFYGVANPGNTGIGSVDIEYLVVPYADRRINDTGGQSYPVCS